MEIIQTFWLAVLFVLGIHAYLSFSLISQDAVATTTSATLDRKRDTYPLPPLSKLCPDVERLTAILSFSRLLFMIPVLLLTYKWTVPVGVLPVASVLVSLILLLYILPEWKLRRTSLSIFRGTVQILAYVLYPLFWVLARLTPVERLPEPAGESDALP